MKLIKLKLALVVALLSFAFVSASASDYDFEVDGLGYKIISLEDLSCSVADEVEHHTELEIPSIVTYKGRSLSVIKIENHAFKLSLASNVVIPNSILTIGEGAFEECYSLKNVTIGNSVDTIGARAFSHCI